MTPQEQQEKLEQFTEFFTIAYKYSVNVEKLIQPIDPISFENSIPLPFKLASDNATIDQKALRSLNHLAGSASQLVNYLQQQANKIDLLVQYILSQHDDTDSRVEGTHIGGGGLSFKSSDQFLLADNLITKIFLPEHNCAVYCHGEVIEKELIDDSVCHYKVIFNNILEDDREILVKTSLHIQSKELQLLAQLRNEKAKSS